MIHLGLSSDDHDSLIDTLFTQPQHRIQVELRVHNQDEQVISSLSAPIGRMVSGAVQVDSTAAITRTLNVVVLDPNRKLRFEANSPAHGALFANRFISVLYQVWVDDMDDWVDIPVFWGPLSSFARNGAEVTLEAQGKESLMLEPHNATFGYTIHEGERLDDAIRTIARKSGETRFDIPNLKDRLNSARNVTRHNEPWLAITNNKDAPGFRRRVGGGGQAGPAPGQKPPPNFTYDPSPGLIETIPGNYGAFYDGRGRLCVRKLNRHSAFTFKQGDPDKPEEPAHLIADSPPQVSYDITAFRNYVLVNGGKPKGKKPAQGHASLPATNPMSPHALARNDMPRYMTEFITADNLKTDDACDKRAEDVLDRLALEGVDVSFACLPLPMLEENDVVTLQTDEFSIDFQVRQYTIPLVSDESMSIGRHERVKIRKRKHHKPPHRGHHGGRAGPPGRVGGRR